MTTLSPWERAGVRGSNRTQPKPHNPARNNPPTFTIIGYYGFRKYNHSTNDS